MSKDSCASYYQKKNKKKNKEKIQKTFPERYQNPTEEKKKKQKVRIWARTTCFSG